MEQTITLKILLELPPPGIWFGLQKGKGNAFSTEQTQLADGRNLVFDCPCTVKVTEGKLLGFKGPFVQGKSGENFIYIDIGQIAGQLDTHWSRRLKIPLVGITIEMVNQLANTPSGFLQTEVPGTGKDGGPNCATVKPFSGWRIANG